MRTLDPSPPRRTPAAPVAPAADVGVVTAPKGPHLHLLAGQLYFGSGALRIRTLLGSCVGVTLWNPRRKLGGMCHFLLPKRPLANSPQRDARFGADAMAILTEAIARAGTKSSDYVAHLYGGADTLPDQTGVKFNVGERNIEFAWQLVDEHGFQLEGVDVGDTVPRNVELDLATGEVTMRRGSAMK